MRLIRPVPELLIPGKWKKSHSSNAAVDITNKTYTAPLDEAPSSEDIRNHEYNHLAFSPPKEEADKLLDEAAKKTGLPLMGNVYEYAKMAFRAIEDARVNWLGTQAGVGTGRCTQADVSNEVLIKVGSNEIPIKDIALLAISADGYERCKLIEVVEQRINKYHDIKNKLNEIIKTVHDNAKDFNKATVETALDLALFFYEKKKDEPEKNDGSGGKGPASGSSASMSPTINHGSRDTDSSSTARMLATTIQQAGDGDKVLGATKDPLTHMPSDNHEITVNEITKRTVLVRQDLDERLGPATMIGPLFPELKFERKHIRISPKKVPAHTGTYIRYTHRLAGDKKIFSDIKRFDIGTILIDCSGSMDFSEADIMHIIKYCSGATIAIYSGHGVGTLAARIEAKKLGIDLENDHTKRTEVGYLHIVAKDGKILDHSKKSLRDIRTDSGGGNMVDIPALQWLSKQRGKKFWVSDGIVTGSHECQTRKMSMDAERIKKQHKIKQIYSIREMRELIDNKSFKKYKDPWPDAILSHGRKAKDGRFSH